MREGISLGLGEQELGRTEKRLAALEVKNKVRWVNNEHMRLPFRLAVGEKSPLARFLTPDQNDFEAKKVRVHPTNYRSMLAGRVIFEDDLGTKYRDLDIKGGGFIAPEGELRVAPFDKKKRSQSGPYGFVLREYAEHDRDMAEMFSKQGFRTYRVVAIIDLEEIVDESGHRISIDEAKKRGILVPDDDPVIEIRAFTTKMRIANTMNAPRALEDGMEIVRQERGLEEMDEDSYLEWFGQTLGREVARMHALGYTHGFLGDENITLDCRLVDLDSIDHKDNQTSKEFEDRKIKDRDASLKALTLLVSRTVSAFIDVDGAIQRVRGEYIKSYSATLGIPPEDIVFDKEYSEFFE